MGTSWSEVVTTALLGTDRRPPPADLLAAAGARGAEADPVLVLLDHAARHRAVDRTSTPLERCPAAPEAPADHRPWASASAQELLARLLVRPVPELVNAWLAAAAGRGVRPSPEHWTDLVTLAATRPDYDRGLLSRALGADGIWFVEQNPSWSQLAETLQAVAPAGTTAEPAPAPLPAEDEVRRRPEVALAVPAPWPRSLTLAALRVLVSGQLGWGGGRYGSAVGARVAAADSDLVQQALDALPDLADRSMPGLRIVRDALLAAAAAVQSRAEIEQVFDDGAEEPDTKEWR